MRVFILLLALEMSGCAAFIAAGGKGLGGEVVSNDTLKETIDQDFPAIFHNALYVLHKRGYEVSQDRDKKILVAQKENIKVWVYFYNPVPQTTEVKVRVWENGKPDLEEASCLINAIFKESYNPSQFLE